MDPVLRGKVRPVDPQIDYHDAVGLQGRGRGPDLRRSIRRDTDELRQRNRAEQHAIVADRVVFERHAPAFGVDMAGAMAQMQSRADLIANRAGHPAIAIRAPPGTGRWHSFPPWCCG